jgi:hypothetical protein
MFYVYLAGIKQLIASCNQLRFDTEVLRLQSDFFSTLVSNVHQLKERILCVVRIVVLQ